MRKLCYLHVEEIHFHVSTKFLHVHIFIKSEQNFCRCREAHPSSFACIICTTISRIKWYRRADNLRGKLGFHLKWEYHSINGVHHSIVNDTLITNEAMAR